MNFLSALLYTNRFENTSYEWLDPILKVLDEIVWPILIVLASVGVIYAIYLGVILAKAENAEAREEAKKRIINVVIAIVIVVVLVLLMKLFVQYAPNLLGVDTSNGGSGTGTGTGVIGLVNYAKFALLR